MHSQSKIDANIFDSIVKYQNTPVKDVKIITLQEFSTIVNDYESTKTTLNETFQKLDSTLSKIEPKKGEWILESGPDIDFLDRLASNVDEKTRPRGRFVWDSVILKYSTYYDPEEEYEALRIMDEAYLPKEDNIEESEIKGEGDTSLTNHSNFKFDSSPSLKTNNTVVSSAADNLINSNQDIPLQTNDKIEHDDTSKTKKVKFTGHPVLNVPAEKKDVRQQNKHENIIKVKKTKSIVVQKDKTFTNDVSMNLKTSNADTAQLTKSNSESNLDSKKKINPDKIRIKFKNSTSSNTVNNLKTPKSEDKSASFNQKPLKDMKQN